MPINHHLFKHLFLIQIKMEQKQEARKKPKKPSLKGKKSVKIDNNYPEQRLINKQSTNTLSKTMSMKIEAEVSIQPKENNYILNLLKKCEVQPYDTFKKLLDLYRKSPVLFSERVRQDNIEDSQVFLLLILACKIVKHNNKFPVFSSQEARKVFKDTLDLIKQSLSGLTLKQLDIIKQTSTQIWQSTKKDSQSIVLNAAINFCLKIPLILAIRSVNSYEQNMAMEIIRIHTKNIIFCLQNTRNNDTMFKSLLFCLLQQLLRNLQSVSALCFLSIPVYDIVALSFKSYHKNYYSTLINMIFDQLTASLEQKSQKMMQEEHVLKQNELTIKTLFFVSNIFDFTSIYAPENSHDSSFYSKQVIFMIFITNHKRLMKLLEQIQKIQRNSVPKNIIRAIFQMSYVGSTINKEKIIQDIASKVIKNSQWLRSLEIIPFSCQQQEQQTIKNLSHNTTRLMFDLLYRIEKLLAHYDFEIYMDLYIENPSTYCSQYFINSLYQGQHLQTILKFMVKFTDRWVYQSIFNFDFQYYLLNFFKKCVRKDSISIIGRYIKLLQFDSLIKINEIIFKLSFQDDKKRFIFHESNDSNVQFASLTSAGYAQKYIFINKLYPIFSQQLVWKQIINMFCNSNYYLYVKAFYSVLNYEINFRDENMSFITQIYNEFLQVILKPEIQKVYSIFHMICCLSFRLVQQSEAEEANKFQFNQKIFELLMVRSNELFGMCKLVCQRRSTALRSFNMNSDFVKQTYKNLDKLKRMNSHFMKNISGWIERLENIEKMIKFSIPYETIIEKYQKYSQQLQFGELHLIRILSKLCSQHYFSNTLQTKIKPKLIRKQLLSTNYLMHLRQIINVCVEKYSENEDRQHQYCINQIDVLSYYERVLSAKVQSASEREQLKHKLIVMDSLYQLTAFFSRNQEHSLAQTYHKLFHKSLKFYIIQYAIQNPQLISKYDRQLILHLRTTSISMIFSFYKGPFQILSRDDMFSLVLELCLDKIIEMRVLVLNFMTSRFKHDDLRLFVMEKYRIAAMLTIFTIMEPNPMLKVLSSSVVEKIKKAGQDNSFLSLIILLLCLKYILMDVMSGIKRQYFHIYIDSFLESFHSIWLSKKQQQYAVYRFIHGFCQQKDICFNVCESSYQSHIQKYVSQDYLLKSQIEQYIKNQSSFQNLPEQYQEVQNSTIKQIIESLPERIFTKLKTVISEKTRNTRIIKSKKDFEVHWDKLEEEEILKRVLEPLNIKRIEFPLE